MAAHEVPKGKLASAFPMVGAAAATSMVVPRGLRGAPCIVKHTVVERGACSLGAPKVLKEAHRCAKDTVEVSVAFMMVVGFALRVYMEAQISASPTVVERGVVSQGAVRVLADEQIAV